MANWRDRSQIEAAFLNPAVSAAIQAATAGSYKRAKEGQAMVWPLSFLVVPLVLHRPTRTALPGSTRTHLSRWVSDNPVLVAGLHKRAKELTPTVFEGMRFGIRYQMLSLENGRVLNAWSLPSQASGELSELLRCSAFIGRWIAKCESPSTVFALLGMRP